jgi:hypothetical protein
MKELRMFFSRLIKMEFTTIRMMSYHLVLRLRGEMLQGVF